jgi:hypothetical protein
MVQILTLMPIIGLIHIVFSSETVLCTNDWLGFDDISKNKSDSQSNE